MHDARVNLVTHRASISVDSDIATAEGIAAAIAAAGYESVPVAADAENASAGAARAIDDAEEGERRALARDLAVAAALTLPLLVIAMSHGLWPWTETTTGRWLQAALATPVVFGPGGRFFRLAWMAARHRAADMNTLVALGTGAAWTYSALALVAPGLFPHAEHGRVPQLYFEAAAAVFTFVLLGKLLEARARKRLSDAVCGLVALQPTTARVLRGEEELSVAIAELVPGDLVVVRPGERIAADGVVVGGSSAVDDSMLRRARRSDDGHDHRSVRLAGAGRSPEAAPTEGRCRRALERRWRAL